MRGGESARGGGGGGEERHPCRMFATVPCTWICPEILQYNLRLIGVSIRRVIVTQLEQLIPLLFDNFPWEIAKTCSEKGWGGGTKREKTNTRKCCFYRCWGLGGKQWRKFFPFPLVIKKVFFFQQLSFQLVLFIFNYSLVCVVWSVIKILPTEANYHF